MTFPYASTAFASTLLALTLASACTSTTPTCATGAACFCDDCGQSSDGGAPANGGCPAGTVFVAPSGQSTIASGCVANVSCGTPVVSTVYPATWSAAEQACASSSPGATSLIATTPCGGFVSFVYATPNGDAVPVIYDATTGAPVALIGSGTPFESYVCVEGEVSIPAACLASLVIPTTTCASFDAGVAD